MLKRSLWLLLFAVPALAISPQFEEYEGGSQEAETKLIQELVGMFKFVQLAGRTPDGKIHRGTHSKGTCATGTFKVLDLKKANPDASPEVLEILAQGLYKQPASYKVPFLRFANGRSVIGKDSDPDVRALSFSVDLGEGKRQDFSMNSVAIFPIGSLTAFNLFIKTTLVKGKAAAEAKAAGKDPVEASTAALQAFLKTLPESHIKLLKETQALGELVTKEPSASYRTEIYWSGTAFKQGPANAAKTIAVPCDGKVVHERPENPAPSYLQEEIKAYVNSDAAPVCFDQHVQLLDTSVMRKDGKELTAPQWVEDPTIDWDAAGAPSYKVGQLEVTPNSIMSEEDCDNPERAIDVGTFSLEEHKPLGRINRGRHFVEVESRKIRDVKK